MEMPMQALNIAGFDRSRLEVRLEPKAYFTRLLESGPALRRAWIREDIENRRKLLTEVWRDGDEVWYWRYRIDGGISGSDGLAIVRNGELAYVWSFGFIL
jgi:hypothetical protein